MNAFHDIAPLIAGSGWDHGGWFPFGLLWTAVLGTVIWLVVRRVRRRESSGIDRATEILAERYARGELSGEEYRERLEQLRATAP
ncbi:MAG TPA: hypothetical protein VFL41_05895 [Gaiellaceae bacterium]|nr:hypothetical protein [Gaiellaceae bacterium]